MIAHTTNCQNFPQLICYTKHVDSITLYHKTTCSKSRGAKEILDEKGIKYTDVLYYNSPLSPETLKEILFKLDIPAQQLMRTNEQIYKDLDISSNNLNEEELIAMMIKYPDLMERPVVVKGGKAIIARPSEKVLEIL
jgi:arsenate reductase (glutaredoxin)